MAEIEELQFYFLLPFLQQSKEIFFVLRFKTIMRRKIRHKYSHYCEANNNYGIMGISPNNIPKSILIFCKVCLD